VEIGNWNFGILARNLRGLIEVLSRRRINTMAFKKLKAHEILT